MPEVRANGVSLYYEEHGAGQPLVLIHGTGSSAAVWGGAVSELARRARTIVYGPPRVLSQRAARAVCHERARAR